jgi:spermidine synthase
VTPRLVPQTPVGRAAVGAGGLLAAAYLLGDQGTRVGPVTLPAWSAAWLLLPPALAWLLGWPSRTPASFVRLAAAAAALALVGWPLATWRAALVRPDARLPATVDSASRPGEGPRKTVQLDIARTRRLPLWRLVGRTQDVALEVSGYFWAPEAGPYVLTVTADDSASLHIDGHPTIARTPRGAAVVPLTRGTHRLGIRFEQHKGPASLSVEWDRPAFLEPLPMSQFVGASAADLEVSGRRHSAVALSLVLSLAWWIAVGLVLARAAESRRSWAEALLSRVRLVALPGLVTFAAGVLFLFSGVAALIYQVVWQRVLAFHSGVGTYSVAIIVGAFMAGLGIGSLAGGRLSSRLSPARALLAFALVEAGIGAFALASLPLYFGLLHDSLASVYASLLGAGMAHFASLLLPTLLMGLSLPLLVRALVHETRTASSTIGYLYGINVVGAALGALVTPWLLIRHLGLPGAVHVGAAANCLAGIGALGLWWAIRPEAGSRLPPVSAATHPEPDREAPGGRPFGLWVLLYGVSGFAALSLEIVWFRVVDVAVKSSAFSFGTVLAIYLAGLAGGSLLGTKLVTRVRAPLRAFLTLQGLIGAYSMAAMILLVALPPTLSGYDWYVAYWAEYGGFVLGSGWQTGPILRLYLLLPASLYLVPTFCMGLSFPILQKAVQDDPGASSRRVGTLQAANIVGCVAGSLVVGLLGLTVLGTAGTLRALGLLWLAFAAHGLAAYGARSVFSPLAVGLALLAVALPSQERLWRRLHGHAEGAGPLVAEDASAVVALVPQGPGAWRVAVNGQGHSQLPYGGVHSLLGAIPALVHPLPQRIAIIGLGSGDTAWAAACRSETLSVSVFEIAAPEHGLLRRLADIERHPALSQLLSDSRVQLRIEDGRHALRQNTQRFDVIEMDLLEPHKAYSGNIYSVEFFRLCASRLAPGGIVCSWVPTPRIRESFRAAFPHVVALRNVRIFLGSNDPIALDGPAWLERLRRPALLAYLGPDVSGRAEALLANAKVDGGREGSAELNEDLFPRDEFLTP